MPSKSATRSRFHWFRSTTQLVTKLTQLLTKKPVRKLTKTKTPRIATTMDSTNTRNSPNAAKRLPAGFSDHYALLGVSPTSSLSDIKAAYRALRPHYFATDVLKYRQLQDAFVILADAEKRVKYDTEYARIMGTNLSPGVCDEAEVNHNDNTNVADADWDQMAQSPESHESSDPATLDTIYTVEDDCTYDADGFLVEDKPLDGIAIRNRASRIPILKGYVPGQVRHTRLMCNRPQHLWAE